MRTRPLLCFLGFMTFMSACGGDDDAASTPDAGTVTATTMAMDMATTAPAASTAQVNSVPAEPGETAATGELPMEVTVDITDFTFGPAEVSVAVGGTITFVNNDTQAHTATSTGAFDTGDIPVGESMSVTVDAAGTFEFRCAYHPFMTGTVSVG